MKGKALWVVGAIVALILLVLIALPLIFDAKAVDVNSDGSGGVSGDNGSAFDIFLGHNVPLTSSTEHGHGLQEGQAVIYQVSDSTAHITNLSNGGLYYVHVVDAWTIQLSTTYCGAVTKSFDSIVEEVVSVPHCELSSPLAASSGSGASIVQPAGKSVSLRVPA